MERLGESLVTQKCKENINAKRSFSNASIKKLAWKSYNHSDVSPSFNMCFTQWAKWDYSATYFLLPIMVVYNRKGLSVIPVTVLALRNGYVHFYTKIPFSDDL